MNTRAASIFILASACVVILTPATAPARVHFSIGVGTIFGCPHPYYGWCGDWHWHRYPHAWRHWDCYSYRPWCRPTVGVWLGPGPVVTTERHVVVEKRVVDCPPAEGRNTSIVSEAEKRRRDELLKRLRIGGSEDRLEAARRLAGCAGDAGTRDALERALLSDREPLVRQAAAESLAKRNDSRALPALKRAYAEDFVREVRQAAYKAIIMTEGY